MTRHEEIRRSYKELGGMANIYDGIITRSTLLGKLMDGLIWGLDGELSARWIEDALARIRGSRRAHWAGPESGRGPSGAGEAG